jgi:hypothetical protein
MSLRVTNRFDPGPERIQEKCRHDDTFKARRFDSWRYRRIGRFILQHLKQEPDAVHDPACAQLLEWAKLMA